ncbi:MAG TPA: D-alanyl-D-alanine carboxypeptidase family protein [Tissierellaceae bacterium]|nr:D-alanyl-D-alanine carboxypeptidase family protein [Tissierellaceae bacterium]
MDRRLKYLWGGVLGSLILLLPLFMRNQVISIEEDEEISLRVDYELNQQLKELEDRLEIKRGVEVGLINGPKLVNEKDRRIVPPRLDKKVKMENDDVFKYAKRDIGLKLDLASEFKKLTVIPKGEKVKVIGHLNGWDKLIYKDYVGYSLSEDLSEEKVAKKEGSKAFRDQSKDRKKVKAKPKVEVKEKPKEKVEEVKIINGIILVNKEYPVPKNYYKGVDPKAKNKVDKMLQAAREEAGFDLIIHSAYRSYNTQKTLFNNYVRRNGYDRASMYSAKPGHSEHETGLAFDICDRARKYYLKQAFGDSEEGIWLRENAHRFGFILRYPKDKTHITGYIYEPWHFRYVGEEHAKKIYEKDITLEEYLEPDRY